MTSPTRQNGPFYMKTLCWPPQLLLGQNSWPLHGFGALYFRVSSPLIWYLICCLCTLYLWILWTWVHNVFLCFYSCAQTCIHGWNFLSQSSLLHLWDAHLFYNKYRGLICGNSYEIIVPLFIIHSPLFTILNCVPDKIVSFIKIIWKFTLNLFYFFMYMSILPACMSVHSSCDWWWIGHQLP